MRRGRNATGLCQQSAAAISRRRHGAELVSRDTVDAVEPGEAVVDDHDFATDERLHGPVLSQQLLEKSRRFLHQVPAQYVLVPGNVFLLVDRLVPQDGRLVEMEYRVEIQPLPGKLPTKRIAPRIVEQAGKLTPQLVLPQQTAVGRTGLEFFVRCCSPRQIGQAGRQFPGRQRTLLRVLRLDQVKHLRRDQRGGHDRFVCNYKRCTSCPLGFIQPEIRGNLAFARRAAKCSWQKSLQRSSRSVALGLAFLCGGQQLY